MSSLSIQLSGKAFCNSEAILSHSVFRKQSFLLGLTIGNMQIILEITSMFGAG